MLLRISGRWLREKYFNDALLLFCVIFFLLMQSNINYSWLLFVIKLSIFFSIIILILFFGIEAHRYCFIVSFPTVFLTLLLPYYYGLPLGYAGLVILLTVLLFSLYFSLKSFFSLNNPFSKFFYFISPISPLILFLSKNKISTSIFEGIFLAILVLVFLTSFFLYLDEFSFYLRKVRSQSTSSESRMNCLSDNSNLQDNGKILSFFVFQIALVQYFFDSGFVIATIVCMYIISAVNNHLRFVFGIDFQSFIKYLSVILTSLNTVILIFYWWNLQYSCVICIFASLSLLFFLTSFSVFIYENSLVSYKSFFERISDLNFLFVPIFVSMVIYRIDYTHNLHTVDNISEPYLLLQSMITGLVTITGIVSAIYIPVATFLIRESRDNKRSSGHRALLATSPIILSFSLRCFKLLDCAIGQFIKIDKAEICDLAYQMNNTLIILMVTALSIIFFVYKSQNM